MTEVVLDPTRDIGKDPAQGQGKEVDQGNGQGLGKGQGLDDLDLGKGQGLEKGHDQERDLSLGQGKGDQGRLKKLTAEKKYSILLYWLINWIMSYNLFSN